MSFFRKIAQLSFLFCMLNLCFGCAVIMNMPTLKYDSPEAEGTSENGIGGLLGLGYGGDSDLTLVSDTTATPLIETRTFKSAGTLNLFGGIGVTDHLDLLLDLGLTSNDSTPTLLRAKYQFIGDPHRAAKAGNFAVSAVLGVGLANQTKTDSDTFSTPNIVAKTVADFSELDAGIVAGYRVADAILVYGEPYADFYHFSVNVTRTSGTPVSPLIFSGQARVLGFNFGIQAGTKGFSLKAEAGYADSTSLGTNNTGFSAGTAISFHL